MMVWIKEQFAIPHSSVALKNYCCKKFRWNFSEFFLKWIFWCLFRFSLRLKLFPQWWQGNVFSAVWTRMCFLRSPAWWKDRLQSLQWKGFSPVWQRKWIFRFLTLLKSFPRTLQLYEVHAPTSQIFLPSIVSVLLPFSEEFLLSTSSFGSTRSIWCESTKTWGLCPSAW